MQQDIRKLAFIRDQLRKFKTYRNEGYLDEASRELEAFMAKLAGELPQEINPNARPWLPKGDKRKI